VAAAVGLTLVALAAVGFAAYQRAADQLLQRAEDTYAALMELRRDALQSHLQTVASQVRYSAADRTIRGILEDFSEAWDHLGSRAPARLRSAYVLNNPYPVGERHLLEQARDGSAYTTLHGAHHDWLRGFLHQHGYYDIFLIAPDGDLIYTAFKEEDFGTNLLGGPYRESGLGAAFRGARDATEPGTVLFSDFAPYTPSHGKPAAFVASPVFGDDGELLGVLAFQLAIEPIDAIMQVARGMGETGETFVVGSDFLMRSDSRFGTDSTILRTRIDTPTVRRTLAGETGVALVEDHAGVPVLSAYGPLEFLGVTWAVIAEVDQVEVLEPIRRLRNFLVAATIVAMIVVSTIVGFSLSWTLNRPAPRAKEAQGFG
jgi:methyl-accepting chemotaxis protein